MLKTCRVCLSDYSTTRTHCPICGVFYYRGHTVAVHETAPYLRYVVVARGIIRAANRIGWHKPFGPTVDGDNA